MNLEKRQVAANLHAKHQPMERILPLTTTQISTYCEYFHTTKLI